MIQHHLVKILLLLGIFSLGVSIFMAVRQSAFRSMSYGHLKCLGTACNMYSEDHDGRFPPTENPEVTRAALAPYIASTGNDLWQVPGQPGVFYQPNPALSRKKRDVIEDYDQTILLYEPTEHLSPGYGRRVAYVDGKAQFVASVDWAATAAKNGIPLAEGNKKEVFWDLVIQEGTALLGWEMLAIAVVLWATSRLTRKR